MRTRTRLLATFTAAVLALGACSDQTPVSDETPTRAADRGDRTPKGDDAESPASPTKSTTDDDADGGTGGGAERTVAVYYVADTERAGPRLYREFQKGRGDALDAAVSALNGTPLDPDYRTMWRSAWLSGANFEGGVLEVTVDRSVRRRPGGMSAAEARAAVEQVIYTLQAAVQERAPVQFRAAGGPIGRVFGVRTSRARQNGPMLEVLSHLSLTSPEQGSVVGDGTLEVSGVGNSFEANVGWEIRQGTRVVRNGFATMSGWTGPKLFPFETTVDVADLPPGDYTFWATTDDPSGGEGIGAMADDKSFTVQ